MADYYTRYHFKKFSDTSKLLNQKFSSRSKIFSRFSMPQMNFLYDKIKEEFQTPKGNWSIKKYENFKEKHQLHNFTSHYALQHFYNNYSKRKKKDLKFESFLNYIDERDTIAMHNRFKINRRNAIKLKDNVDFKEFLSDVKRLKNKHLESTHEELADLLLNNFNIEYSKKTLVQYLSDSV